MVERVKLCLENLAKKGGLQLGFLFLGGLPDPYFMVMFVMLVFGLYS